ncbi:hypothetical protein [Flavobacterium sp.]|uniref:hypothetical protein n=1 Tax=Flavobacterium sp. TaxID=239 RepID=UPI0025BCB2B5|nr:hypothetical protein [Flavobacterium sp.]
MLLESHDSEVRMPNKVASFNARTISWMILDFAPNDNFEKQEQVLDETETIALEVMSYFKKCREDHAHWLYGKYEGDFEMQKVGPIFDNRFGWNVIIQIKNQQKMCFEAEKWNFPTESV